MLQSITRGDEDGKGFEGNEVAIGACFKKFAVASSPNLDCNTTNGCRPGDAA